jgi:hypothetical protein
VRIAGPTSGIVTVNAPQTFVTTFTSWTGGNLTIDGSGDAAFSSIVMGTGTIIGRPTSTISGTISVSQMLTLLGIRIGAGKTLNIIGSGQVAGTLISNAGTLVLSGGITVAPGFVASGGGAITFSGCTIQQLTTAPASTVTYNGPIAGATTVIGTNTFPNFVWQGTVKVATASVLTLTSGTIGANAVLTSTDSTARFAGTVSLNSYQLSFSSAYLSGATFTGAGSLTGTATVTASTSTTFNTLTCLSGLSIG